MRNKGVPLHQVNPSSPATGSQSAEDTVEEKESQKSPTKEPGRRGRPPSAKNVTPVPQSPISARRGRPPSTVKRDIRETKREGRTRTKSGSGKELAEEAGLSIGEETNESAQCKF